MLALLRWPAVAALVALLVFLAFRHVVTSTRRMVDEGISAARALAAGFRSESITTTFRESLPTLDPDGHGRLTVARLEVIETTRQDHESFLFWGRLPLGRTVTQVRVPVVYQFEVSLDPGAWRLELRDAAVVVHAPAIELGPPPSLRTDAMEVHVEEGWMRFDGDDRVLEVIASLTPEMSRRAQNRGHGILVRAGARRAVEEFVRSWLLIHEQWGPGLITGVEVEFADDPSAAPSPEQPPPTRLQPTGAE